MYDVITVADTILKIAKSQDKKLTPMQLVKLTYIAHGWSFVFYDRGLFSNRIEAWQYGPVAPDLYHVTKNYGRSAIPLGDIGDVEDIEVSPEDHALLVEVFNAYGHLDGISLSRLTHKVGTPWKQVYNPNERRIRIPDHLIAQHYRELASANLCTAKFSF